MLKIKYINFNFTPGGGVTKRCVAGESLHGFTFLEVLISLSLLSIILLSLDAINIMSLRVAKAIWCYQMAVLQAENFQAYQRAEGSVYIEKYIVKWNQQNASVLPNGRGEVKGGRLTIFWGKNHLPSCNNSIIATSGCLAYHL